MLWIDRAFSDLGPSAGDMIVHEHFKIRAKDQRLISTFGGRIYKSALVPLESDGGSIPDLIVCSFLGQFRNITGGREYEFTVRDVVRFQHPRMDVSKGLDRPTAGPDRLMAWLKERRDDSAVRYLPVMVGGQSHNLLTKPPRFQEVEPVAQDGPAGVVYHLILETICTTFVDPVTGRPKDIVAAGG